MPNPHEKNNTKKSNIPIKSNTKKVKKVKKKNRLHVIFDIDATLISSYNAEFDNINNVTAKQNLQYKLVKSKDGLNLVFLRYYYDFLMKYCLENFDVSIWTAGPTEYAEKIIKNIYSEDIFKQLKCVIGRIAYTERESITYKDIKNNIIFNQVAYNDWYTKKMDFLFTHKFYSKMFNKKKSILVDDSCFIITQNQFNSIQIPKFCVNNADNNLFKLYLWLDKHKNTKDIRKIDKDIFYTQGKLLCDIIVGKVFKISSLNEIKSVKKKQYQVGEEVYFNLDKKLDISKSEKLSFGVIKNINKDKYDILYPGDLENDHKNYKNINVENIRKYIY